MGIPDLKLSRNIGGVANLKLPRNIYGIDYLKLPRKTCIRNKLAF